MEEDDWFSVRVSTFFIAVVPFEHENKAVNTKSGSKMTIRLLTIMCGHLKPSNIQSNMDRSMGKLWTC